MEDTFGEKENEIDLDNLKATIINDLQDQNDFISALINQMKDLYELKKNNEITDFHLGFHMGEIYKHMLQFQTSSNEVKKEVELYMKLTLLNSKI